MPSRAERGTTIRSKADVGLRALESRNRPERYGCKSKPLVCNRRVERGLINVVSGCFAAGSKAPVKQSVRTEDLAVDQDKPVQHGTKLGARAIVIGGGIAGLATARALADHFDSVIVLERDALDSDQGARPGTPQDAHLHFLQAGGLEALSTLFPGFQSDLERAGAVKIRIGLDFRDEIPGLDSLPRRELGMVSYSLTRPLLESLIRRRVKSLPNVAIRDRCRALSLITATQTDEISGVLVASPAEEPQVMDAAFVVDATGRGALIADLLQTMGLAPPEVRIGVDAGYATAVFATPPSVPAAWKVVAVRPAPPRSRRGAIMVPIEGERWMLSLAGVQDDRPPGDEAGFMAFVRDLPTSTIHDGLKGAVRLGDIRRFRFPESVWRRYDTIELPRGLLPIADAISRFNPIYGQGMTVAVKEAVMLARLLREHARMPDPLSGFNRAFQTAILPLIDAAWSAAAVSDFAHPTTRGERPVDLAQRMALGGAIFRAAFHDPEIHRLLLEVRHMVKPAAALRSPYAQARISAELVHR